MTLPETIYEHVRALPAELQREALDFVQSLEQRYRLQRPSALVRETEAFIARFAGSLSDDFPDDINDADLDDDVTRDAIA